jgi:UDP-N-acetyl-2-amino-2-deoxyglucuronate dehydrogenase
MAGRFGIGIVGAGMAAKPHALALKALHADVEVRGVYRRDAEKRREFAAAYGFSEADSLEALLADPGVSALLVLTPPNAREEIAVAAARAGKHILMEKPVERTTEAAARIVNSCEESAVRLGIIFQHRFREGSLALKRLLEDGRLGPVAAVHLVVPWWRPQQGYYDQPGRGTLARDGGGVLISQAIHSLDLMLSLAGPVHQVQAVAGTTALHQMETEDFVAAGLRFANGAIGGMMATTAHFPGEPEYLVLDCAHGSARLSGSELVVRWHDGTTESFGAETSTGGGADPMDFPFAWHQAQIAEFVEAVRGNRDPLSNGRTALRVHRLIDALLASSASGKAIHVEQD